MQLENLDHINVDYRHVYLSPHLDDAALSCGGAILRHQQKGERALVVTLCTAAPASDATFSALAQEFHSQWALAPEQVVAARLVEDHASMQALDVDFCWAGLLDAIYRYPEAYTSRETLFNQPAANDPLFEQVQAVLANLRAQLPNAQFYAPMGIGSHVDHLLTQRAARAALDTALAFYEDTPYVIKPGALEQRFATVDFAVQPDTLGIDATLAGKLDAVAAYASQLNELFGGEEAMRRSISEYARGVAPEASTYGERIWRSHT